ncbi:lipopolysaccharide export system protein LptA [Clostridium pascui]|uniref:carbohydrate-binding domain-containing protein n=1 Tax=Clostridium pascui TaxID=46609 RepID=UPI001956994A|nr:carbohydrate-binding domain-containing protein [Clostridium pascui]MBM7869391.1 lipopolysaccharide export system protein LptA [Clostridium pascui]
MNKKLMTMIITLALCTGITGCTKKSDVTTLDSTIISNITMSSGEKEVVGEANTFIELGDSITINGSGASVEKNKVTITSAGTYSIKGSLTDGQIIVNAGDKDKVYIILNGVNIACSNNSPIYVMNCDKTIISLGDNTKNYVNDGKSYVLKDVSADEPNAAIFSKDDITFTGKGSLTVNANYKNGIRSKDDLKIEGGTINITSKTDGIIGKDSVVISDGNIKVNSGEDGIKSDNAEDLEKGYVLIEGGILNITAAQDGIQGETNTLVKNGNIAINSGGGSKNAVVKKGEQFGGMMGERPGFGAKQGATDEATAAASKADTEPTTETAGDTESNESTSAKAIKAGVNIVIENGTFTIDSSEDAIHSNNNLVINNGNFNISSGDDGMHADSTLTINKGTINIKKSYEGIESETITINDGNINVLANDDGLNAAGGNDSSVVDGNVAHSAPSKTDGGAPGSSSGTGVININGGYINVNAAGDGIDANGSIYMKNGTVVVNGPANDGNGSLDYDGSFEMTGGFLVSAGSLGMAQAPSSSSTQNSVKVNLSSQSANTLVRIESEAGDNIVTFAPSKQYASVVVSSPKLKTGSTYKVYIGGSSNGTPTNGVYSNGTYTKGTEIGKVTISSTVSEVTQEGVTIKNMGRGQGGPGGHGGQRGQGAPDGMEPPQK